MYIFRDQMIPAVVSVLHSGNIGDIPAIILRYRSIGQFQDPVEPLPLQTVPQLELQPEWIELLTAAMDAGLPLYRATRAVHSCFVLREGRLLFACEDIGRHNALDKAVGQMLLQGIPLTECVLYTSGRVPVDMVRKAIRAGVPALVSKTMPTVQSLELAQEYGLQLVCGRKHPLTLSKMEK